MGTAERRKLAARIAALSRWAQADPVAGTAPARRAFLESFERQVDPTGSLPPAERARRAKAARRAHMLRLAARSAEVRRARQGGAR